MSDRSLTQYADLLRNDFSAFVHRAFLELEAEQEYDSNWHIDLMAAKLEAVRRGETRRLIINLPPRHLKSFVGSVAFPAFILGHNPSAKIMCISYAQDFAEDLARPCRSLMESPFYKTLFKTKLAADRQAVDHFATTANGFRHSTSYMGGITGRGADFLIIDDPIKAEEAQSEVRRDTVNEDFFRKIANRLNNQQTGAIVLIMQRLHSNDLTGFLQKRLGTSWEILLVPALAVGDERYNIRTTFGSRVIKRSAGGALQPARLPLEILETIRQDSGEYNFAAQYQQNPIPSTGGVVKTKWLKRYQTADLPDFDFVFQSWDTANKISEQTSYSVCTTWGVKGHLFYLLHVYRKRMEFPELKQTVRMLAKQKDAEFVVVEDKASGQQLIQELRGEGIEVQAAPSSSDDKATRLMVQTAKFESGFVLLPEEQQDWLDAYVTELTLFPNVDFSDQVDSTVNALAWRDQYLKTPGLGLLAWYQQQARQIAKTDSESFDASLVKVRALTAGSSDPGLGRMYSHSPGQILSVDEETAAALCRNHNFERVIE